MASLSGGQFYRATNARELQNIYNQIDQLEKTEVKLKRYATYEPLFQWPLLAALFAVFSVRLVWNSYAFHDISTGNDATPLWIPQIAMGVGAVILMIAFIDELVLEIMGKRVQAGSDEALHHE